jgi:tripartite-type tricarboxylate transporter receptor subunit TctC
MPGNMRFVLGLLALLLVPAVAPARAETYPDRPVTVIVPFPAGSATDAAARKFAEGMQRRLGQSFVVENKAGADGSIAARFVAAAPADGYTLLVTTSTTQAANPSIYRQLPYDPQKDFASIGGILRIPFMLAVRPDFPADDFAGFAAAARAAKPGLLYASANAGSRAAGELLRLRLGVEMAHVPYRGSPQALTDLIGGRLDLFFSDPAAALGLLQENKFKVLAVTGPQRVPSLSHLPTLMELGVADFNIVSWVAAFAPAGTPRPIIDKVNAALNEMLREPDMIAFVNRIGSDVLMTTPEELDAFVAEDARRWVHLVEIAQIEKK